MTATMAMPGNTADTFLVHLFGTGLADDKYVVERFQAMADGDIVPVPRRTGRRQGQGEARGGLAPAGRGDASRPHRDRRLHRAHHPRRHPALGVGRNLDVLRAQAARLSGLSRPAPGMIRGPGRAAGRPSRRRSRRYGEWNVSVIRTPYGNLA